MKDLDPFDLEHRIQSLEQRIFKQDYALKGIMFTETARPYKLQPRQQTLYGLYTALVISTKDPWKIGRVKYFTPLLFDSKLKLEKLPWALPISPFGGFDDCGVTWVPPAGSTITIMFENGNRDVAYYLGTIWHRDRGTAPDYSWGYQPMKEYEDLHEDHRKGYLVGANDGSQVFPPWNTSNYQGFDLDSSVDDSEIEEELKNLTYPHIYGFKTPQKHLLKMDDGDYRCNHKNKRLEIMSSLGNWMCFKDDHLHSPSWSHPDCGGTEEKLCDNFGESSEGEPRDPNECELKQDADKFHKMQQECRPFIGPQTPQNNRIDLPQSGIQFLSLSGHSFVMDDSVKEPRLIPEWEKSLEAFDFGCDDVYWGKTYWVSATGHRIEMNDFESETNLRGEENGLKLISALGNKIELNDHCIPSISDTGECTAGEKRGVTLQSTSNHIFEMIDSGNIQTLAPRKGSYRENLNSDEVREEMNDEYSDPLQLSNEPISKATEAYVKIRTGYGLEITMDDAPTQEETDKQNIMIFSPQQKNGEGNIERGPHIVKIQEAPDGPGQILIRAGGDYIVYSYDSHFTVVGDKEKNPANKLEYVSKSNYVATEENYINKAKKHVLLADDLIFLLAGKDCPIPNSEGIISDEELNTLNGLGEDEEEKLGPCVAPVLTLGPNGITVSDRVFASSSKDATTASIFMMTPFFEDSGGE